MKNLIFSIATLSLITSASLTVNAQVREGGPHPSLSCDTAPGDKIQIQLTARALIGHERSDEMSMNGVVAEFKSEYYSEGKSQTGRRSSIDYDASYSPRKYKSYNRFNLRDLIDTKSFAAYLPGDFCEISVLIPKDAFNGQSFEAPTIVNCDQGGLTTRLYCELN